jgi:hypothetical protein
MTKTTKTTTKARPAAWNDETKTYDDRPPEMKVESPPETKAEVPQAAQDSAPAESNVFTSFGNSGGYARDGSGSTLIRGTKVVFTNEATWCYGTSDGELVDPERRFVFYDLKKAVQKWVNGLPAETIMVPLERLLPDYERWNDELPRSEWRESFGQMKGPWERSWFLYLCDAKTLESFCFVSGTFGAQRAIDELMEHAHRTNRMQGTDNLFPVLTLGDTHMATRFGGRRRPHFNVVDFIPIGGSSPSKLITATEPEAVNDSINY